MSLYHMLFGVEPTAGIALKMLDITPQDVPRFRDAYFAWADAAKTDPVIILHTRTGGGNRADYAADNDRLTKLAGYRSDHDDAFDRTYAEFWFAVPDTERDGVMVFLTEHGEPPTLQQKFDAAIAAIKQGRPEGTPS